MSIYHGYQGARSCTSGPQTGARGLMAWFLAGYSSKGGLNTGIYNCRSVRGGRTTSLHGEGRAVDLGIRPYSAKYGTQLAEALRRNSKELGIQCIIWNRKIWSGSYPNAGWRRYSGVAHHKDHIHVELSWGSAKWSADKMVKACNKYLGDAGNIKVSGGGSSWRTVKAGDLLRRGTKGTPVKELQKALGVKADGYFGSDTEKAVKAYQKKAGLSVDGIAGPKTLAALKGKKAPAKPTKKAVTFPLASGHFFSQPMRTNKAHSGFYSLADRKHIVKIQKKLKVRADGLYGDTTAKAVRAYQKKSKLKVDSVVGSKTWKKLFS